ncbi:sodium-dependent bicarbonate transport family permease [Microbulbifer sp. TYP-18]|uniref:sodium-dependent bicarbonate transport family permease n=1 Tax=Microbulbifer sp. TYP-18 TaxID=3230024 RepID=UPI0034C5F61F
MQLDAGIAFFILGAFAALVRSDIQFPKGLYQSLILFLMVAIGLKGGVALAEHASWQLINQSIVVILLGVLLPLIAFPVLFYIGELKRFDAASIAAHYGSVSVGTYAVAVAFLEAQGIAYESYIPLFVVLLEMPAIAVGIALARRRTAATGSTDTVDPPNSGKLFHEVFFNQGMVLMVGGLAIGMVVGERIERVTPFFFELFNGVLALFLLKMGMMAAGRLSDIKRLSSFMLAFGVAMPIVGGALGCLIGLAIGLSTGGTILLAVLGASASYIAVPAAMQVALPQANQSLSIGASLGITFPFNVLIGIPTITVLTQWIAR